MMNQWKSKKEKKMHDLKKKCFDQFGFPYNCFDRFGLPYISCYQHLLMHYKIYRRKIQSPI